MRDYLILFSLFSILSYTNCSSIYPDDLTIEYLKNPLAVDRIKPRLGWILKPTLEKHNTIPKNLSQTAYQILVASSEHLLTSEKPDLWDTKKHLSDSTLNIQYEGKILKPGQTVFWTVRVWDQHGYVSRYATPSYWAYAFTQSHWKAKWIGAPEYLQQKALANLRPEDKAVIDSLPGLKPILYFRKQIRVDLKNIKQVRIYVTAKGLYRGYYNGKMLMFENNHQPELTPGWTNYNKSIHYQVYDVTKFTTEQNVTVGAILGPGWHSGYVGSSRNFAHYGRDEFLLMELHVDYKNGVKVIYTSDETWKVTTGPLIYSDVLMGELFYENRQLNNFMSSYYNDSNWSKVVTEPLNPAVKLLAEAYKGVTILDLFGVQDAWQLRSNVWVYDFGVNFAGYVSMSFPNLTGKVTIQVIHGEMLDQNGAVYTLNLRSARAIDTYVLNDPANRKGPTVLQPHFTFHGFRYIEISGLNVSISKYLKGVRIGVRNLATSLMETNNEMVNKLYGNIVRGELSNMISIPTDCPQRDERLGWMADAQTFALTAIYNGDIAAFYTNWMRSVREAQSSGGGFPNVSPRLIDLSDGSPAWGDAGVIITWYMYRMYEDLQIVRDNYEAMQKWLNYIESSNPTFIWKNKLNHNYGDWNNVNAQTPKEIVSTAYYAYDALLLSQMAEAINKTDDAKKYKQLHWNISKAFNKQFVNQTTGKILGDTQCGYVLALAFDLLPSDHKSKAVQHLVDSIKARNWHLSTGFIGIAHLLPVLSEYGRSDVAFKLLLQDTYPSWGFTIKNNATTMWERWDGWSKEKGFQTPSMNSFNHYSFGSVGRWMFEYMAGIDTDDQEVGFKKIIIKPHLGDGIQYTRASYNSIRGLIQSNWTMNNNKFSLRVNIPPNTKATVILPFLTKKWEKEINSGIYEFEADLK